MAVKKKRADILLVEHDLCENRSMAQRLIMAGAVRVHQDHVVHKPNEQYPLDTPFTVDNGNAFVSRAAHKLLAALRDFPLPQQRNFGIDIGASTGGFTEVLLHQGIEKVYAVDVGVGQLHYRLRNDPRVVCLEQRNARYLRRTDIPELCDVLTVDVSFISLEKIIPVVTDFLACDGRAYVLVKPQFEASREEVGKGGVVRDNTVRAKCVDKVKNTAVQKVGWICRGTVESPIRGPKGNRELIAIFDKDKAR